MIWESGSTALQVRHLSLIRRFERIESGTLHVKSASWMGRPQVLIVLTGKPPMFPKLVGGRTAIFHRTAVFWCVERQVLHRIPPMKRWWREGPAMQRRTFTKVLIAMSRMRVCTMVFFILFLSGILLPWNGTLVKLSHKVIFKVGRVMSSPTYFFKVPCGEFFSNDPRFLINRCSPKAAASSLLLTPGSASNLRSKEDRPNGPIAMVLGGLAL